MPFFRVILSGSGISFPSATGSDPLIGFFTTRDVRAVNTKAAEQVSADLVLAQWRPGGEYAATNEGTIPTLVVDQSFEIGFFRGVFGRKPSGYTFYTHE